MGGVSEPEDGRGTTAEGAGAVKLCATERREEFELTG